MNKLFSFILLITGSLIGSLRLSAQVSPAAGLYDTLRSAVESSVPDAGLQQECRDYIQYVHPDGNAASTPGSTSTASAVTPILSAQKKSFILIHPDYHLSLLLFKQLVETGEITKAQRRFEEFSQTLQQSALGRATQEAIHRDEQRMAPGKMAPDFTAKTPDGKEFHLSSLKGKYVLLDFWASWCGPCRLENPNLVENYHRFKNKNFTIVSFSLDGNVKAWQDAIDTDHLDWIHVSDLKDWHSDVVKNYMVPHVPQDFLIDPDGKIIAVELRGDDLGKELEKILK